MCSYASTGYTRASSVQRQSFFAVECPPKTVEVPKYESPSLPQLEGCGVGCGDGGGGNLNRAGGNPGDDPWGTDEEAGQASLAKSILSASGFRYFNQ